MRTEPDIDRGRLVEILRTCFGIETNADDLVFNAEGHTAASYHINAHGRRYIVKQWPEHSPRDRIEQRLRLARAIRDRDVYAHVAYPIPVRDGSSYATTDPTPVAVFPFIVGKPPIWSPETAVALGKAVAAVHRARTVLSDVLPPETDSASEIQEELLQLLNVAFEDRVLSRILVPWREKVLSSLDRIGELDAALSAAGGRDVVCHMDLHPNNLIENEAGLHILDWDESVMAPPEHDLFSSHGPLFGDFIESYTAAGGATDLDVRQFAFIGLRTLLNHVRYGLYLFTNGHDQRKGKGLLQWALPRFDSFDDQLSMIEEVVEHLRHRANPDFDPAEFRQILLDRYGIEADAFTPVADAAPATNYIVEAGEARYFLKRWLGERDTVDDGDLRLARALHDRQVYERVACALPAMDGALHITRGRKSFAVFPFIDGTRPEKSAATYAALGEAMAQWHRATQQLADVFPPTYKPTVEFAVGFLKSLSRACTDPTLDPVVAPWRDRIVSILDETRELEASLPLTSQRTAVVCHMDLHRSNLIENERGLYVLDWDEASLAPPEFDLYAGRGPFFGDLLRAYVAAGGTSRLDPRQFALIARRSLLDRVDNQIFEFFRTHDQKYAAMLAEETLPRFDTIDDELGAISGVIDALRPAPVPVREKPALALGFATIDRPHVVQRLVRSVRRKYPDMRIYVADQSRQIEPMQAFYEAFDVNVIHVPYDAGVAASRNAVVAAMTEPYFVLCDDDMFLGRETSFDEAVDVLEHRPELGVVGGKLYDLQTSGMWDRHWELLFEYDPANRLMITLPIYWLAPRILQHGDTTLYRCDAVLNFAVFRRSIFSDTVKWDERFTCNGEHEDFYLNLKLNTQHKVAYLPTMVGFHNHPPRMERYEERLRMRAEGWRLYLEKWNLDQQLEEARYVRTREDIEPSIPYKEMRERFDTGRPKTLPGVGLIDDAGRLAEANEMMGVVPPAGASGEGAHALPASGELFISCAPVAADQIFLWCLWNPSEAPAGGADFRLRWYADDGEVLVWESAPVLSNIRPAPYWQPYFVDVPPLSPRWNYVRFEVFGRGTGGARVLATGYLANEDAQPGFEDGELQVLGLSASPEAPARPVERAARDAMSLGYTFLGHPEGLAGLALLRLADVPADVNTLHFHDWELLPGKRFGVALPPAHLRGASVIAVPCRAAGPRYARLSATTGEGECIAFALRRADD